MISNLDVYRKSVKLSQRELALRSGCTRETINRIERCECNPSLELAYSILNTINEANKKFNGMEYEIGDIFPNPRIIV